MDRLIPIARPSIQREEREAVLRVLQSYSLAQGERVREFEGLFSDHVGTEYAVATNSGTAALHAALCALGLREGDEVILPAITFFSCAAMIARCGATPVVADVGEADYNLSSDNLAEAITPATRAIMAVHMYGQPADMGAICDLAGEREIPVIEDACQSHGARYGKSRVGSMGSVGCFSFYPTKMVTTGEGGMVTTDDGGIADHSRMFRDHGASRKYHHEFLGYNYRMTEIAAALGIEQLGKIETFIQARSDNANYLSKTLATIDGLDPPQVLPNRTHVYYQYVVRVAEDFPLKRDEVVVRLRDLGVESRPSYPMPIHQQPAFQGVGRSAGCPVAERILPQMLELPVHPLLSAGDLQTIASALETLA
ncbi:MAG: DegT/DnrJ/EryC1/StrS family aminotransferase [Thermoplasmata archaeon]